MSGNIPEVIEKYLRPKGTAELPATLECVLCHKKLDRDTNFSLRQLYLARRTIKTSFGSIARCHDCNEPKIEKVKCFYCNRIMQADAFSKAQRRNRDTPKCLTCVKGDSKADPVPCSYASDEEPEEDDDTSDEGKGPDPDNERAHDKAKIPESEPEPEECGFSGYDNEDLWDEELTNEVKNEVKGEADNDGVDNQEAATSTASGSTQQPAPKKRRRNIW